MKLEPWPLAGYAPGDYTCRCIVCERRFDGDKRAYNCLECAASIVKKRALTANASAEAVAWRFTWPKPDGTPEEWSYTDDEEHALSLAADDGQVEPLYLAPRSPEASPAVTDEQMAVIAAGFREAIHFVRNNAMNMERDYPEIAQGEAAITAVLRQHVKEQSDDC